MIGITPSTETVAWRQDNPIGGFVSEFASTAVPYVGWFKATKALRGFDRAVESIGSLNKTPFVTGALQTGARFAPFEVGRLAASQVVGDKPFGSMLAETGTNLALGSGIGGLLHGFAAAGTRDAKLASIFPGLDIAMPLPLQVRQAKSIIDSGSLIGEALDTAKYKLSDMLRAARVEELPSTQRYVAPISHDYVQGADTEGLQKQLDRLFRARQTPDEKLVQIRRFAEGAERDFKSANDWNAAAREANLGPGFEADGQFFRHVSFKNNPTAGKIAQTIDNNLTKNMESVGAGDFISREADDGLFVIARKVAGKPGTGAPEDKWVLFKTDKPGQFLPDADRWAKTQVAKGSWTPGAQIAADGGDVFNALKGYTEEFPLRNYMAMGKDPTGVAALIPKLLPQSVTGPQNEIVGRFGDAVKEYLAPRIYQFKKSWRANWIVNGLKLTYDAAENNVQRLMNGSVKIDPGRNLFIQGLAKNPEADAGLTPVRTLIEQADDQAFKDFVEKIWRPGVPLAEVPKMQAEGAIHPDTAKIAASLEGVNAKVWSNVNKAEVAAGHNPTEAKEGHYGLSRTWEGDTRIAIQNDAGEIVAQAAGPNRREAQRQAAQLLKENPGWSINKEFSMSQGPIPKDLDPFIASPSFLLENQGMRGFKWDLTTPTKNEFLEGYENALRARMRYQANLATDDILGPNFFHLQREDPAAFRMVDARRNDYAGVQSAFGRWQNKVTDQVLGPSLGTNSASKIVQITNTSLFNLQLGALKLSYPVVNALQFLQTVLPETAFIMGKAPPERLAGRYSFFAAGGEKGPVGGVAAISPIKMLYQSTREMARPSAELSSAFERAVNDRVIDPRIVENYIGESAIKLRDVKKAFQSGGNFTEWLRAMSEFLPAETERLSRTQAFTNGYIVARDFLKGKTGEALNPDQIYNFAKQFTENSMYLYGASDKPRIFTTPAGSLMGLFKNWMMHYMASMGEFAGEGFAHNNWAPLMWQTTGTFALGGLAATPAFWAADKFSKMWNKKSIMENAYAELGAGGDAMMLGLPAALTGISLYSNVNSPMANPVRDASQLFSVAAWDRVKQTGKLIGGAMDNWQATGEHPAHNEGVREQMARAFGPTTLYRSMAAFSNPDKIIQLGNERPILKDVPAMHRWFYAFGFNPTELDRAQTVSQELYSSNEKMKAQIKSLGDAWSDAEVGGNTAQMAVILRQSMVWGVDPSKVIQEGMKNLLALQKDVVQRSIRNPRAYEAWQATLEQMRNK